MSAAQPAQWVSSLFVALSAVLSLAILGGIALCIYWLVLDREPPMTVLKAQVTVGARSGDGSVVAFVRWHVVRHRPCPGVSRRWLVNEVLVPLPDIAYPPETPDEAPGPDTWEVAVHIPGYLTSNTRTTPAYRVSMEFACNPLQQVAMPILITPPPVPLDVAAAGGDVRGDAP